MSFWVFKKCCFCIDLRLGCFIIAYLTLIMRVVILVLTSIRLSQVNDMMIQHGVHSIAIRDTAFHRLVTIISLMILVFEILLCIALIVGLCKRLDEHLEMYYVGSSFFIVLGVIVYAVVLLRYAELFGIWAWLVVAVEICLKLIVFYFLAVIRSYYYKMRDEIKDLEKRNEGKEASSYFARTKPALISSKP